MRRVTGVTVGVALIVVGFIAGTVIDLRDEAAQSVTAANVCSPVPVEGVRFLNNALVPWSGLTFDSPAWITHPGGPLSGLTIVRTEVDGPGFEAAGDLSIWAVSPYPIGTFNGPRMFPLNPVARRVDGRSTYPAKHLRQFTQDGGAVYDPRVIRAIAPAVAGSCINH